MPKENDTQDGGYAYAEAPEAGELLGVPDDRAEILPYVDSAEKHSGEIGIIAKDTLSGDLFDIVEIDGVKYRVSKGNEHFADATGIVDEAYRDKERVFGFRLMQQYRRVDQQHKPIILVQNGNVRAPVLTINQISKNVYDSDGIIGIDDAPALRKFLEVVAAIKADSLDHAAQDARREEEQSRRRRRGIMRTAAGIAVAALLTAGIPQATEWWEQHEEEQAQEQAIAEAREAEEIAAREEQVHEFDEQFSILNVSTVVAGEPGLAEASDQFIDLNIPDYGAENISENLAHDVDGPREIELDFGEDGIQEIDLEIRSDDQFRVIHDGAGNYLYNFVFNAENDQLIIQDNGTIAGDDVSTTSSAAEHVVIERVNGSN